MRWARSFLFSYSCHSLVILREPPPRLMLHALGMRTEHPTPQEDREPSCVCSTISSRGRKLVSSVSSSVVGGMQRGNTYPQYLYHTAGVRPMVKAG